MERVLAGEDVGAGEPHERQPPALWAAADGGLYRNLPRASDRLHRVVDDLRMSINDLLHIPILLLDLQSVSRTRKIFQHVFDNAFKQVFLLLQTFISEIAHDEADRRLLQRACDADRVQKSFLALGRFGRASIFGQALNDSRGDLDRVLHFALCKPRMGADTVYGEGDTISRKRLVLDIARRLAIDRISEIRP